MFFGLGLELISRLLTQTLRTTKVIKPTGLGPILDMVEHSDATVKLKKALETNTRLWDMEPYGVFDTMLLELVQAMLLIRSVHGVANLTSERPRELNTRRGCGSQV